MVPPVPHLSPAGEPSYGMASRFLNDLSSHPARTRLHEHKPGRRPVLVREGKEGVHLIQPDGASVRVTSLTACSRTKVLGGKEICTRFAARHAWHFDTSAFLDADASFRRQPSGAAAGRCEPWNVERWRAD